IRPSTTISTGGRFRSRGTTSAGGSSGGSRIACSEPSFTCSTEGPSMTTEVDGDVGERRKIGGRRSLPVLRFAGRDDRGLGRLRLHFVRRAEGRRRSARTAGGWGKN